MDDAPICRRCDEMMVEGIATDQTYTGGTPDLGGEIMTLSAGGPGRIIRCWKCLKCGRSLTK